MENISVKIILLWMLIVLIGAGLFVTHIWKQNHYVKLTKSLSASRIQLSKIKNDIANIQLDNKKLKDYKRLEHLAKKKFGLEYAGVPEFIYEQPETITRNLK